MTARIRIALVLMIGLFSLALSGCITVKSSIYLRQNGSGELTITAGIPTDFINLQPEGLDVLADVEERFRQQFGEEVEIEQWSDLGYEWRKVKQRFSNLDELNRLMAEIEFVESFSIQKQAGLPKDRFSYTAVYGLERVLAKLKISGSDQLAEAENLKDLSELQVSIRLPGTLIETNGNYDDISGYVLWSIKGSDPFQVHATSEAWNLIQLGLYAAIALASLFLFVILIILLKRIKRKRERAVQKASVAQRLVESIQAEEPEPLEPQPTEELSTPSEAEAVESPSKILAEVGASQLLDQVNDHVLKGMGDISAAKGAIRIIWSDPLDETVKRGIMIRVQDANTLLINGQPFPATPQGAKEGLISCLKGMEKE